MARVATPIACVLLAMLASGEIRAEPDSARAKARAQFEEGQKAFDRKDYGEALRHFRRAFELRRHDAVRFNIGVCLERLGRFREAVSEYEAATQSKMLAKADRKRAATKADAARAELGTLVVEGTPEGAEVVLEGDVLCRLPCKVPMDPGQHQLVIRSGELTEKQTIFAHRQRESRLEIHLHAKQPAPAAPTRSPAAVDHGPDHAGPTRGPGWMTWTGAGLAVVGGVGIAAFGTKAQSEHDDFVKTGSEDARTSGTHARDLTNVSIGVVILGAALASYDLFVLSPKPAKDARWRTPTLRF